MRQRTPASWLKLISAQLYSNITYTWNEDTQLYYPDMTGVITELQKQLSENPNQGKQLLGEFARSMRAFGNERTHCLACRELFIEADPDLAWVFDTGGLDVYDELGQGERVVLPPHVRHLWI